MIKTKQDFDIGRMVREELGIEFDLDSNGPSSLFILPDEKEAARWRQWYDRRMAAITHAEARFQEKVKDAYLSDQIDKDEYFKQSRGWAFSPFERLRRETNQTYSEHR